MYKTFNDFTVDYAKKIIKYRWLIIIASVILIIISIKGVKYLTFNNDNRVFFSHENPQLKSLEKLENTYNKIDNVIFGISPKSGDIFNKRILHAIEELTEDSWQIPYSSRVDSITNFQHTQVEGDELIVKDLVDDAMSLNDEEIDRIKDIALRETQLVDFIVSSNGKVTAVDVNILMPGKSIKEVPKVASYVRKMRDKFNKKYPDIDLYITGAVMMDNAFGEISQKDMVTLIPIMFLVLVGITGLALRSFVGTFSTLIIILISMGTGLGLAGWLNFSINVASANAPTIILTLAVADSVHILSTMIQEMRLGKSKHEAIVESMRINFQPVFLTSFTTVIGFLSMNLSDAPPFRDLGNIVAMGVTSAFIYSITFLPALLAVIPIRTRESQKNVCKKSCEDLANFVIAKKNILFWILLAVMLFLTFGIFRINLDDQFMKYIGKRYDIRKASDYIEKNLRGWDIIEYSMESGESGGINKPEYLKKLEEFTQWYKKQPKVTYVSVYTNVIKRLNRDMNEGDEAFYKIPDDRNLTAQYLLLYEMSLPFGQDLNNMINVDKSSTRMIVFFRDITSRELIKMDKKARLWLKKNAPKEMFTYGSGLSIIWAHLSERNIKSMLVASFLALFLISITLVISLRNIKLGVVSLIPNLAPAFMTFGIWGFFVRNVGLGLSVIAAMTIGIVVDDTIHFMSKYLRARREYNMNPEEAVKYSFNTVGTALWITTLALVLGFLVLTFSGYRMNSDMGLMAAITISIALLMDFLFLPTLLMKVEE